MLPAIADVKRPLLILAQARTGSSALFRSLTRQPEIVGIGEPFHPRRKGERFIDLAKDADSFCKAMNDLLQRSNCIKHMMSHVPVEYHEELFRRQGMRVLLLHRNNLLKQAVSVELSRQAREWNQKPDAAKTLQSHTYEAIPVDRVRLLMRKHSGHRDAFRNLLETTSAQYLDLTYESLYGGEIPLGARLDRVEEILRFAGYDPLPLRQEPIITHLSELLNPKRKTAGESVYRRIPNIDDIERELGSDETGYLFS